MGEPAVAAAGGVVVGGEPVAAPADEDSEVGSLGAALIQALREAGEDPSELAEDN